MRRVWGQNKFSAKRVERAGYSFASKLEAALFDELRFREMAGDIKDLRCQETVRLTKAQIAYRADFSYLDAQGNKRWCESKGVDTQEWLIKKKLWKYYGPGPLDIYKGRVGALKLVETVIPVE